MPHDYYLLLMCVAFRCNATRLLLYVMRSVVMHLPTAVASIGGGKSTFI